MDVLVWLALLVVFIIMEGVTVAMVSAWFAVGALVALIVGLLGGPLWLQIVLFLAVSTGCLFLLRPFAQKMFNNRLEKTNVDAVIGQTGVVMEAISNSDAKGRVKLDTMTWAARSSSGQDIAAGVQIRVDRVEGVKVYVTPLSPD